MKFMNWGAFWVAFSMIFVAELGDKTQLMCLSLSSKYQSFWPVFTGAMAGFVVTTALAVLLGTVIDRFLPIRVIQIFSGCLLIVLGGLILLKKI